MRPRLSPLSHALQRAAWGLSCRKADEGKTAMTAMIDMHAHWRPAQVADALRARTREPRILRNQDGVEVLKAPRMGEAPLADAFDNVDFHLGRMDRQGVEVSVLSLLGSFCWVEALPLDESGPLCQTINDGLSAICQEHPGRFAAYAALPLTDISAAAAELERALGLPGMIGAQVPGNYFLTRKDAEAMRPLLEVTNRHRAVLFIHNGPRPGDAYPKVAGDTDNAPPQWHARHAGEPVLGDGDIVSDRLPRGLPRRNGPRPQFGRQYSLRGRAHGPPQPARHAK
jgi:predicted TIM-barrel fold metal-dependent hydrolase